MTLPLPFKITTTDDPEAIQSNFDEIAKQFPFSRRHAKVEQPHRVGDPDEPAFLNGWVNEDPTTFAAAQFWKDPMGVVHVVGTVQSGTIGQAIFTLPSGYRPSPGVPPQPAATNTGYGEVRVAPTGQVVAQSGGNGYFGFSIHFKQEN